MLLPFARQSKSGTLSEGYSGERLVNYFLRPSDGLSQGVLVGRSGTTARWQMGGIVRALIGNGGSLFAVSGGVLFRLDDAGPVIVGELEDDPDTFIAANGSQIAIVAGGKYYLYDGTTTAEYPTGAIDVAYSVAYMDGYFIVVGEATGRKDGFTISGINDGKTFDATEFAFAENSPDEIVGVIADHGELWLMGTSTTEVWQNTGNALFPFERIGGALMERGCLTGRTIAKQDNAVFWVGNDRIAYRGSGTSPQVISTREIEEQLSQAEILGGFTFQDRGHLFYAIIRDGATTLLYDITTGLWCEASTGVNQGRWFATCRATLGGIDYFGTTTGKVVRLDPEAFTDAGETMVAEATSAPVSRGGDWFRVNRLHVEIRGGVGGIGRQPRVMLQTSHDGRTWSTEKWRDIGAEGQFGRRTTWHALGAFRRAQARIRISDPVPRDLYGVTIQ